jgi:hypothetical protein
MRVLILLGLSGFMLAACDSPYGKDFSKPDASGYALSTGSHIKGATTSSSVNAASSDVWDSVVHSSAANRDTIGR